MSEPTALDILKAARAKIADEKDWRQGIRVGRDNQDSCCAVEAIEETSQWTPERKRAMQALFDATGKRSEGTLCDWNDDPERTHAEVLAAFDLAISTLSPS